jgi:hypothetical protein
MSLDDEIRDHLEREIQDNMDRGMSPEEARTAALRKFGNVTRVKEETREVWRHVGSINCCRMFATVAAHCGGTPVLPWSWC